jgi:hypothetical protein
MKIMIIASDSCDWIIVSWHVDFEMLKVDSNKSRVLTLQESDKIEVTMNINSDSWEWILPTQEW